MEDKKVLSENKTELQEQHKTKQINESHSNVNHNEKKDQDTKDCTNKRERDIDKQQQQTVEQTNEKEITENTNSKPARKRQRVSGWDKPATSDYKKELLQSNNTQETNPLSSSSSSSYDNTLQIETSNTQKLWHNKKDVYNKDTSRAQEWATVAETAFSDPERQNKFLKLLGAKKKDNIPKPSAKEPLPRPNNTSNLNQDQESTTQQGKLFNDLEKQFSAGLERRGSARGLGFL